MKETALRYCLQQEPDTGRWVIVSSRDSELLWQGRHWQGRDRTGAYLSFANANEATAYAEEIFK
jgi:hypothetical protein